MFSFTASADQNIDTLVEARININFQSATDFNVNVECNVEKITLSSSGKTYTNNDIKTISGSDPEKMGAIKYALKTMIYDQINDVFLGAKIASLKDLLDYQNYKFYDTYSINLTTSFFGLNETANAYELINGVLDMSAVVNYDFVFKANEGWNITYIINLGEDYKFKLTNGKTTGENIEWTLLNGIGEKPEEDVLLLVVHKNPTSNLEKEDITLDFCLDSTTGKTEMSANINLKSINISDYDFLPSFITGLTCVPSDGLRLFVKDGLLSWDEIRQKTVKDIEAKIKSNLETSVFNQTLDLTFLWDNKTTDECETPYDIKKMNRVPAVTSILRDEEINLLIEQIPTNVLFGLVNTGATASLTKESINFGEKIKDIGYSYNVTLKMPENIEIDDENNYTWNENKNFSGMIMSKQAPDYQEENLNTVIEMKVESVDLNLLSFFTGDPKISLGFDIEKEKNYNVTKLPKEFSLPEKIDIDYLNSDALRICIDENIFKKSEIEAFLNNEKTLFDSQISKIIEGLEVKGNVGNKRFEESLQWDQDILHMDAEKPVTTRVYAYTTHPLNLHISITPPSVKIPDQTYNFTGLKNQSVTYKIIFPNGIALQVYDKYDKAVVKQTNDERQYLEVTFTPDESDMRMDVVCSITPSALFLIGLFIPCMISIFITLVLLIVLVTIRKKRGGKRRYAKQREPVYEEGDTGYEDRDYYIPPPPGSK